MRFNDEQGRAIINNFYGILERYSNAAQVMQARGGEIVGSRFSGVAVDLYYMTIDLVDNYGYAIAGECVERVAMFQPEMEDPRYFYDVSSNRDLADMQEAFASETENAMEQMAEELNREKEREDAEREQQKKEEEERRKRAREQAEKARETQEKYKTVAQAGKSFMSGLTGRGGKIFTSIGKVFGRIFGRR